MRYIGFFMVIVFCFAANLKAQDKISPWSFGLGLSALDVGAGSDLKQVAKDYYNLEDIDVFPSAKMKISRHIFAGLSIGLEGHFNVITTQKQLIKNATSANFTAYGGDLSFDYHFFIFKFLNPFLTLGAGYGIIGNDGNITGNAGLGLNLWLTRHVGLNFQTSYKTSSPLQKTFQDIQSPTYFQHSFGFIVRFGNKDTDQDGIIDKKDMCPKEKGPKKTKGCPDVDEDGIADKDDECPKEKGTKKTKGCPDMDKDGIADKDDECPKEKGTKKTKGCPDTDKDGIVDSEDECPEEAGDKENKGCPKEVKNDSDGDGILDSEDICPNEAGNKDNLGCPVLSEKTNEKQEENKKNEMLDSDGDGILDSEDICPNEAGNKENSGCSGVHGKYKKIFYFNTGNSNVSNSDQKRLYTFVEDTAQDLKNFKKLGTILLKGHSDSEGQDALNAKLSLLRAHSIKQLLIKKGFDPKTILIKSYGSKFPIATSSNENRSVEAIFYAGGLLPKDIEDGLSKLHKVAAGEDLNTIANIYKMDLRTLKLINGMRNNRAKIGSLLVVEYKPNIQGKLEDMKPFGYARKNYSRSVSGRQNKHKVKRDDTLYSLSKKYNITVKKLQELNGLTDDKIRMGSYLRIK